MTQQLKRIAEKYAIFDSMLEGVRVFGKDWRFLYLNDSAAIHDRFPKGELLEQSILEKYPGVEETHVYAQIDACFKKNERQEFETYFEYANGTSSWYDVRITPVTEGALFMSWDITESKQIEYELRHEKEKLEKLVDERTEALQESLHRERRLNELKSVFVSMVSHEFRTPLSTIITSVNLAEHALAYNKAGRRKRHLGNIKASIIHLKTIVNDFLSLDKLESHQISYTAAETDIKMFSAEVLQELRLLCQKGRTITYRHSGGDAVAMDTNIIRNVLYNLISNALKYSPDSENVHLTTQVSDTLLTMTVTDKGIGIPKKDQPQLFGKFFRAGNVGDIEGTGLGLNIVKRYVDLAGGEFHFTSTPHVGSTFVVTIPQ